MTSNPNKKYCRILQCKYNYGTARHDVAFFRIPKITNPATDIRKKWIDAIKNVYGLNFENISGCVCAEHFNSTDIIQIKKIKNNQIEYRLKTEALPTVPLRSIVKKETCDENTIEFVDIESIRNGGEAIEDVVPNAQINESQIKCIKCSEYSTKLSLSCKRNKRLNKRCEELEIENRKLRSRLKSYTDNYGDFIQKIKKERCTVCLRMTIEIDKHLCITTNGIKEVTCEYCTASFQSTIDFGVHLTKANHTEMKLYKCDCCTLGFPAEILLNFHKETQKH